NARLGSAYRWIFAYSVFLNWICCRAWCVEMAWSFLMNYERNRSQILYLQFTLQIHPWPSHSQVSSSLFRLASKPPYKTILFRTGSYPIAGEPRLDGDMAGV